MNFIRSVKQKLNRLHTVFQSIKEWWGNDTAPSAPPPTEPLFNPDDIDRSLTNCMIEVMGKTVFIAQDVAQILGHKKPKNAVKKYCRHSISIPDLKKKYPELAEFDFNPLAPDSLLIKFPDVSRLIILSQTSESEKFKEWIKFETKKAIEENLLRIRAEKEINFEEDIQRMLSESKEEFNAKIQRVVDDFHKSCEV